MRWLRTGAAALLLAAGVFPAAAQEASAAAGRVVAEVRRGDCAAVARELNAALPAADASLLLLAGALFDEGVCLKPNWERAVRFYVRAHEAGHPAAALRLTAGYAAPRNGPDLGSALWWAHQTQTLPGPCIVAGYTPRMEPERFVATLQTWPDGRAAACAYGASVMAAVMADARNPNGRWAAALQGLQATARLVFHPAERRFVGEVVGAGAVRREWKVEDAPAPGDESLLGYLQGVTARVAPRLPSPPGIPAEWAIGQEFAFAPR